MGPTLLPLLSPAVAVVIAVWGFRRTSRADRLKAFFDLQERYLASEIRAGRKLLHTAVAGRTTEELAALSSDQLAGVGRALAVMNSIAIACEGRLVDRKLVAQSMGRSYATAILAAKPYIDHVEVIRGFRPFVFAEQLAAEFTKSGYRVGSGSDEA